MTRTRSPWSKSIGERGQRVRLYEARPGGPIMRSTWINGKEDRKSLGHRDRELATRQAYELLQGVAANEQAIEEESVTLGMLAKLGLQLHEHRGFQVVMLSTNPDITTLANSMGLNQIFVMVNCKGSDQCFTETLPEECPDHLAMLHTVLEAHRTLMNLNASNRAMFEPLVTQLEKEEIRQQQAASSFLSTSQAR